MSRPHKSRNFLVPLALTATAALAGLGLYLWLGNNSNAEGSNPRRTTEVDEKDVEGSKPSSGPTRSEKRKIVIAVREESLGLLWNLPKLNLATTDIFILVHSPQSGGNPEKLYKLVKETFPKEYPQEYVMPYTAEASLMPLLRHLAPEAVYMDESLVGEGGSAVVELLDGKWVGSVVVTTGDQGKGKGVVDGWQQKYGRRCTVVARSGIRSDWAGRVG